LGRQLAPLADRFAIERERVAGIAAAGEQVARAREIPCRVTAGRGGSVGRTPIITFRSAAVCRECALHDQNGADLLGKPS